MQPFIHMNYYIKFGMAYIFWYNTKAGHTNTNIVFLVYVNRSVQTCNIRAPQQLTQWECYMLDTCVAQHFMASGITTCNKESNIY